MTTEEDQEPLYFFTLPCWSCYTNVPFNFILLVCRAATEPLSGRGAITRLNLVGTLQNYDGDGDGDGKVKKQ